MDLIYENSSFIESTVASDVKHPQNKGNPTENQECVRDVSIPKWIKALLIGLTVLLVFALGGLVVLGIQYANVSMQLSAEETNGKIIAGELEELTVNYTRVKEHLHIIETVKERVIEELTANYTRVREDLNINEKARKITATYIRVKEQLALCEVKMGELTASFTGVKARLSFYEAFTVQTSDFQGKLYFFSDDTRTWSSSRDFCVSKGADLVTITSQSVQTFLHSKVSAWHWIGLNDLETEGRWVWVNGQTLQETGVQFWHQRQSQKSEPDNSDPSGENCAIVRNDHSYVHSWFDVSCKHTMKFICEKKY